MKNPKNTEKNLKEGASSHRQRTQHIQEFLNEVLETERRLPPDVRAGFQRASLLMLEFARSRDRIIYGGQAIHAALHRAGTGAPGVGLGIYKPGHLMDIDIYSPDPIGDMIDASNLLVDNGFRYVMGIGRLHPTTRSVKYDFMAESVLDITHMPERLYGAIPTFRYNILMAGEQPPAKSGSERNDERYVSPEFQVCDLYAALARNPNDNFEPRWKKDCARLDLYQQAGLIPASMETRDLDQFLEDPWYGALIQEDCSRDWFYICPGIVFSNDPYTHIRKFLDHSKDKGYRRQEFARVFDDQIPAHTSISMRNGYRVDVFHHYPFRPDNQNEYLVYEVKENKGKIFRIATPLLQLWFLERVRLLKSALPEGFLGRYTHFICNPDPEKYSRKLKVSRSTLQPDSHIRFGPAWQGVRVYRPSKKRLDSDYFGDSTIENICGEKIPSSETLDELQTQKDTIQRETRNEEGAANQD